MDVPQVGWAKLYVFQFGRCPKCIRTAFIAAAASGAVAAVSFPYWLAGQSGALPTILLGVFAFFLTLWAAHIITYSIRFAVWRGKSQSTGTSEVASLAKPSRRIFVRDFGQALAGIALATSVPLNLQPPTGGLLPTDTPQSGTGGVRYAAYCYDGQCNPGMFCCVWGDDTWCCQSGTSCYPSVRGCF